MDFFGRPQGTFICQIEIINTSHGDTRPHALTFIRHEYLYTIVLDGRPSPATIRRIGAIVQPTQTFLAQGDDRLQYWYLWVDGTDDAKLRQLIIALQDAPD